MEDSQTSRTMGLKSALPDNGTMRTLIGATAGGSDNTLRLTSSSRAQYECSRSEYRMRPIPNEGSMTLGTNSRTDGQALSLLGHHIAVS